MRAHTHSPCVTPAGRLLYVGQCRNEDVFLVMVLNEFLQGHFMPPCVGYTTGESVMSTQHYWQTMIMLAHFLELVPTQAFYNPGNYYDQSLNSALPDFAQITKALYVDCVILI